MQQFIDKLISRLKEVGNLEISMHGGRCNGKTLALGYAKGIENSIAVVNQLAEEYKGGWIPVSERLPEDWMMVYATCISLIDNRNPWVIEGIYFSGCGGFERMTPMLEYGDAEVMAWMPKKYPEPYQKEGEQV